MIQKKYQPYDIVKSCKKLESGLRFGPEGIAACALGPFQSPIMWSPDEAAQIHFTKDIIIERRRQLFDMLNDKGIATPCKGCQMVVTKPYRDVRFSKLGHIDFSATSICNLRCNYCGYTKTNTFIKSKFNSLEILNVFSPDDVEWDAAVDFGGGEPVLLPYFEQALDFFNEMKIRIFLYTNGVKYSPTISKRLSDGKISWVITSLDAGTPSTYQKMKQSNKFTRVLHSLYQYAQASRNSGGNFAVKYIFTEENCGEDDITGFVFAMLAINPDKIWLTFDFEPLQGLPPDSEDFGEFDYSQLIDAYVKMYLLFRQYGLTPGHFTENHLACVNKQGKSLLQQVLEKIERKEHAINTKKNSYLNPSGDDITRFLVSPLRLETKEKKLQKWSLKGKRVLLIPASKEVEQISRLSEINCAAVGIIDRDSSLHGKTVNNIPIYDYRDIKNLKPDVLLIAVHREQHQSIISAIRNQISDSAFCAILK